MVLYIYIYIYIGSFSTDGCCICICSHGNEDWKKEEAKGRRLHGIGEHCVKVSIEVDDMGDAIITP